MKTIFKKEKYFLPSTVKFFEKNEKFRKNFLKNFEHIFEEISIFINNCIYKSNKILFFCCGNSIISNKINSKQKIIHEVLDEENYQDINNLNFKDIDHVVIADIEHQNNICENLYEISKNINDDARVIIISKSLIWSFVIKIYKFFFSKSAPKIYNFLPYKNLKSYLTNCNLEIIRNEKIIFFPLKINFAKNLLNTIFRLPILNFFCMINITIAKKKEVTKNNNLKISYVIPCKNEGGNIFKFEEEIKKNPYNEYLFGNDQSQDKTKDEIIKLKNKYSNVKYYEGPGICKSENVYKGVEISSGDIIIIYDADLTVKFSDIEIATKILNSTNADLINCTRMIYPQQFKAMKKINFLGNIIFAKFFGVIFNKIVTDTLCGTKIFYKKDWKKIYNFTSSWGIKDYWGDFDILLSAYKTNLKIVEVPVHYYERNYGDTKMINLISNTLRMFYIVLSAYFRLKILNK